MIYISKNIPRDNIIVKQITKNVAENNLKFIDIENIRELNLAKEELILLSNHNKTFLKDCPGTNFYRCCDYKVLHFGDNCPFECKYCILNAYFEKESNILYVDIDKMVVEIDNYLKNNRYLRLGTGEFTDSLAYENITNFSEILIKKLISKTDISRLNIELKTKSLNIEKLLKIKNKKLILFSWSLNAYTIWQNEELKTPSPLERIKKAKLAVDAGFKVAFHFDPLIYFENFKSEYKEIIDQIFYYIPSNRIAFISLGSFRFIPMLKNFILRKYNNKSLLLKNEFIIGLDGKMRYPYSLRIKLYKYITDLLKPHNVTLYYCMESQRVWENTLGYYPESDEALGYQLWQSIMQ